MPSKEYHELIEKCKAIHDSKSHDYASDSDPFSNFKFAAEIVKHFHNPIDQVFAGIIGIKLSRIAELQSGKDPKNESLQDSYIDLTNYSALWGAYYLREKSKFPKLPEFDHTPKIVFNPMHESEQSTKDEPSNLLELFPNKCSECNKGTLIRRIRHATEMHSAEYAATVRTLKYPNGVLVVIPPTELVSIKSSDF